MREDLHAGQSGEGAGARAGEVDCAGDAERGGPGAQRGQVGPLALDREARARMAGEHLGSSVDQRLQALARAQQSDRTDHGPAARELRRAGVDATGGRRRDPVVHDAHAIAGTERSREPCLGLAHAKHPVSQRGERALGGAVGPALRGA